MANDLNQCNFIGRLGKDVDIRYMQSGDAVASFSLAVGSQWKNKAGEKQDSTEWVSVSVFGKLAEICGEYLVKGSQIFISGHMKTEKYTDKSGVEKYSTKIIADRMQMLGGKSSGEPREQRQESNAPAEQLGGDSRGNGGFDEDIPFAPIGKGIQGHCI